MDLGSSGYQVGLRGNKVQSIKKVVFTMSISHSGGCLCGAIRYEITGEPAFTIQCYCRDCQRISGAGHLPLYVVPRTDFGVSGPVKTHQRKSETNHDLELSFCGVCASPICNTNSKLPDRVFVMAGSLHEPSLFSNQQKIYEGSRQPWDNS